MKRRVGAILVRDNRVVATGYVIRGSWSVIRHHLFQIQWYPPRRDEL